MESTMVESATTTKSAACKTCPKCSQTKEATAFYVRSHATGQLSSWCKECACKCRGQYKKSERRPAYTIVARAIRTGSTNKPTTCPDCGDSNVPPRRMRGRVESNSIIWSCVKCRMRAISEGRQLPAAHSQVVETEVVEADDKAYCDWCCEENATGKRFCGKACTWAWFDARERREAAYMDLGLINPEVEIRIDSALGAS